jgi:hypothetical protein
MNQAQDMHGLYKKLYLLQDVVLETIFANQNSFYLTGGTALSRFYYQHRYSDDLDFFCHQNNDFSFDIKDFLKSIEKNHDLKTTVDVSTRDFHRYYFKNYELSLQVDFVNDLVYREERPKRLDSGIRIDTINEILSNKICALIDRDEPKDIADIIEIFKHPNDFSLQKSLHLAEEKSELNFSLLIERLRTFPVSLISKINYIENKRVSPEDAKIAIESIIKDLIRERGAIFLNINADEEIDADSLKKLR